MQAGCRGEFRICPHQQELHVQALRCPLPCAGADHWHMMPGIYARAQGGAAGGRGPRHAAAGGGGALGAAAPGMGLPPYPTVAGPPGPAASGVGRDLAPYPIVGGPPGPAASGWEVLGGGALPAPQQWQGVGGGGQQQQAWEGTWR